MREKIRSDIAPRRAGILEASRTQMLAMSAFIYKDLTDDELRKYVEFLESPSAKAMYAASFSAMTDFYEQAWETVGKGIATLLKQRRS
jgi:hypothetical protein